MFGILGFLCFMVFGYLTSGLFITHNVPYTPEWIHVWVASIIMGIVLVLVDIYLGEQS